MLTAIFANENPLLISNALSDAVGFNESVFLRQLHYWLERSNNVIDGVKWVYNTYQQWHEQISFRSVSTLKRVVKNLRDMGVITTTDKHNFLCTDRTLWYTINYDVLMDLFPSELLENLGLKGSQNFLNRECQNELYESIEIEPSICEDQNDTLDSIKVEFSSITEITETENTLTETTQTNTDSDFEQNSTLETTAQDVCLSVSSSHQPMFDKLISCLPVCI